MKKALGQCWIDKVITEEDCMLAIPDKVAPRAEWLEALRKMSVGVLNESGFARGCRLKRSHAADTSG
jgi:hypothetical protein